MCVSGTTFVVGVNPRVNAVVAGTKMIFPGPNTSANPVGGREEGLPRNDGSAGLLAYVAHNVRQLDGTCPEHRADTCADSVIELLERGPPGENSPDG